MWSEHCGYKHSRRLLKTLPVEGGKLVLGPGENAGAVDVGNGLACAFKVESHNHPSAVEPFQGAATGVGGILRDVFAIGARPIAILDSLRFGEPDSARSRYLLEHAVAGIGHYGNSIGVATVGGEIYFEAPVRAELPDQRDVRRPDRDRQADPLGRRGRRQRGRAVRRAHGPRRDRRRVRARHRPSWATRTAPSARPSRSATRSRRASCSSARSSCSTPGCSSPCRTSARPVSRRPRRRWRPRAASASTSTCAACRCARPTWSRSRS